MNNVYISRAKTDLESKEEEENVENLKLTELVRGIMKNCVGAFL